MASMAPSSLLQVSKFSYFCGHLTGNFTQLYLNSRIQVYSEKACLKWTKQLFLKIRTILKCKKLKMNLTRRQRYLVHLRMWTILTPDITFYPHDIWFSSYRLFSLCRRDSVFDLFTLWHTLLHTETLSVFTTYI